MKDPAQRHGFLGVRLRTGSRALDDRNVLLKRSDHIVAGGIGCGDRIRLSFWLVRIVDVMPNGMIECIVAANIVRPARSEHEQHTLLVLFLHSRKLWLPARLVLRMLLENRDDAGYAGRTGLEEPVEGDRACHHVPGAVPG